MTVETRFHHRHRTAAAAVAAIGTAACALVAVPTAASAQTVSTNRGYIGLNVGKPDYGVSCSGLAGAFPCDEPSTRTQVYVGTFFNDIIGMELGYANEGKFERAGGTTRADGANLSAVLRAPLGRFNVFAKGGALYGRTRVSADALSGVTEGREKGWGSTYGAGVGYDFTQNIGVVAEWTRNQYRFAGDGKENVDSTNLGLVYRF